MQLMIKGNRLIRCMNAAPLVLVPHFIKEIDVSAFKACEEMVQLVLPNTLERIHDLAFCGCTELRQVSLHDGVRLRAYGIFRNCPKLAGIVVRRGGYAVQIPIPMDELHDRFLVQLSLLLSEQDPDMRTMVLFNRMQPSLGKLGAAVYLTLTQNNGNTELCMEYLAEHRRQLAAYWAVGGVKMCLRRRER